MLNRRRPTRPRARHWPKAGALCAAAALAALFGIWAEPHGILMLNIASALIGGLVFPLYGISVAHANDAAAPSQRVAVAAGLVLVFGLGSIVGPLITGWAVGAFGSVAYFWVLAAMMFASVTAAATSR